MKLQAAPFCYWLWLAAVVAATALKPSKVFVSADILLTGSDVAASTGVTINGALIEDFGSRDRSRRAQIIMRR